MQITYIKKEHECCCSCKHNIRKIDTRLAIVYCECEADGHYIGYVANFENVCELWEEAEDGI